MTRTGFFPVGSFADPKWCGKSTLAAGADPFQSTVDARKILGN